MRTALLVALAAALLLPAPGVAVAQSIRMGSGHAADAGTAPPQGYLPVEPTDVCPSIFRRHDQPDPAGEEPTDNPTLKTSPCQHFKFYALVDVIADMEKDRLLVLPRLASPLHACYISDLIRSVEALPRGRLLELRFENVSIYGALQLDDINVSTRLSFFNVDFFRLGLGPSAINQPLSAKCHHGPAPDSGLATASILFDRVSFMQPVMFNNTRIDGDLISTRSNFANRFDIIRSDIGGDLVLESTDFARDLVLGPDAVFRGQIVLDGVRVQGDIRLNDAALNYTHPQPEGIYPAGERLPTVPDQARACVCAAQDGSYQVDWSTLNVSGPTYGLKRTMANVCSFLVNLPRCPRSNGFIPALVEINDVNVEGTLSVSDLHLGTKDPTRPIETNPTVIVLYDVHAPRTVELLNNETEAVFINHSIIGFLKSEDNKIKGLSVFRNSFDTLKSLRDQFADSVYVTANEVSSSLVLDSTTFDGNSLKLPDGSGPEKLKVEVTHNRVGRDLAFAPFEFVNQSVGEINLAANRVGGEIYVQLPYAKASKGIAWAGHEIRLTNLDVNGTVALELAQQKRAYETKERSAVVDEEGEIQKGFESCSPLPNSKARISVHFEGTQTKNIHWALPLDPKKPKNDPDGQCVTWLTWTGTGLRYDRWEPGGGWQSGDSIADFRSWGNLYPDAPPDPLHRMADYLWSLGESAESRSVRAEAKRAAFPVPAGNWSALATVGNFAARVVLWPTDFGLKPERAIFLLAVVVLSASVLYKIPKVRWRDEWNVAKTKRGALERKERLGEAICQHLVLKSVDQLPQDGGRWSLFPGLSEYGKPWPVEGRIDLDELLSVYEILRKEADPITKKNEDAKYGIFIAIMIRKVSVWARYLVSHIGDFVRKIKPQAVPNDLIKHISLVPGFLQYDRNRQPQDFSLLRLAVDATLPVIDLHAYNQYFPLKRGLRSFMMFQRLLGWWVLTSFLASLAVL